MALVTVPGVHPASSVLLNRPAAGQQATVNVVPGAALQLGFEPDAASTEAVDKDLVFRFSDGSSIVVTGFFEGGADRLPALQLADGTELSGKDFLAAFNPDLLATAAGPGAGGGTPSSGSGEYADDPGALIDGIDRMGSLGTIYWDRQTAPEEFRDDFLAALDVVPPLGPETPIGPVVPDTPEPPTPPVEPERPGGDIDFDVRSADGREGVYEDWRADKHVGDQTQNAARLEMDFSGTGTSTVESVTLTGFPIGAKIFIGGTTGAFIEITEDGQAVTLTYDQIANQGVYVQAPPYNDADMALHAEVTLRSADGETSAITEDFTVQVDAVADLPVNLGGELVSSGNADHVLGSTVSATHEIKDGFDTDTVRVSSGGEDGRVVVRISVTATFADFDGSEDHYFLVEQLPGFSGPYDVVEIDGVSYFRIPVDNAAIIAADGSPALTVELTSPQIVADSTFLVRTGAMAVDNASDSELRTDNNVAVVINEQPRSVTIDVVDSTLTVKAGWTSESLAPGKHGGDVSDPDKMIDPADESDATVPGVLPESTDVELGAPVTLELSNTAETIQSVTFTLSAADAARGTLEYTGSGVLTAAVNADGSVTYTLTGIGGHAVDGLYFKPVTGSGDPAYYNDNDISLTYQVTVTNAAGATGIYRGESTVVMDAVADPAGIGEEISLDYIEAGHAAAAPGADVTISGSIGFADLADGSEHHYLVMNIPEGWAGVLQGALLTLDGVNGVFKGVGSDLLPDYAGTAGGDGAYLLVEVHADGSFTVLDANGAAITDQAVLDAVSVGGPDADGVFNYTVTLQAPPFEAVAALTPSEISDDVYVSAVAVESDPRVEGDIEYDFANNISVTNAEEPITVKADAVTSQLVVQLLTHEDGMPGQYWDGTATPSTGGRDSTLESGYDLAHGFPIRIFLVDPQAADYPQTDYSADVNYPNSAADTLVGVTLVSLPDSGQGSVYYTPDGGTTWVQVTDVAAFNAQYPNADAQGFSFRPGANWSGEVTGFSVEAAIESNSSGHSLTGTPVLLGDDGYLATAGDGAFVQGTDMYVDSVADLADSKLDAATRADDFESTASESMDEGWYVNQHGNEQNYETSTALDLGFTDWDGSETGTVLIKVVDGVTLLGADGEPVTDTEIVGGEEYWVLVSGPVGGDGDAFGNSNNLTIRTIIDKAEYDGGKLDVLVRTEEAATTDVRNDTANDAAVRAVETELALPSLDSTLTVRVGWAYEDSNPNKFGGTADGADGHMDGYDDAASGYNKDWGVPVQVVFTGVNGEELAVADGVIEFTYDPAIGYLCWKGGELDLSAAPDPVTGLVTVSVTSGQLSGLGFKLNAGYSDSDIQLGYKAVITDTTELTNGQSTGFTVSGTTTLVVDAVADQAQQVGTAVVDYGGSEETAAVPGEEISVTVQLKFAEDASETQYVLLPVNAVIDHYGNANGLINGLTLVTDSGGLAAAMNSYGSIDLSGYVVYRVNSVAGGTVTLEIPVTIKSDVTTDYSGDLGVKVVVVEGAGNDAALWDSTAQSGGHEYDFTNNVAVTDVSVPVKVGVVETTGLTLTVSNASEDNLPNQHTGSSASGAGALIQLTGLADASEAIAEAIFTFTVPQVGGVYPSDPGSFTYKGVTYTPGATGDVAFSYDQATGTVTLTIQNFVSASTNQGLCYKPAANNSDADITDLRFEATVKDINSGAARDVASDGSQSLVIDAVADKPVDVKTTIIDAMDSFKPGDAPDYTGPAITAGTPSWASTTGIETTAYTPGYAAQSFQFVVTAEATFGDFLDGSETHYILVQQLSTGWSLDANSLPAGVTLAGTYTHTDKTVFFKLQVSDSLLDQNGKISLDVTLNTPKITGDLSATIKTGGLAAETSFSGTESDTANNTAVTISNGQLVAVDAVQSKLTVKAGWAPEDNNAAQHLTSGSYNPTPGSLGQGYAPVPAGYGFGTANAALINLSLSQSAQDHFTKIVFTFDANSGEFIYNKASTLYSVTVETKDGTTTVTVTYSANASGEYTAGSDNFYFRPSGSDSDADIKLGYTVTVEGRDNNQITYQGSSTITVDAVADRPTDLQLDVTGDYVDAEQTAARPGEKVRLTVEEVRFHDYQDGSELHYIVVGKNLTDATGKTTIGSLSLAEQTIVVTGTGPNGEVFTQTIVLGPNATASSITITGPNGVLGTYALTAAEYDGMMTSVDGYGNYKIPVLNDFLKLTADGTVSTSIEIVAPNAEADTHYQATVGGYAQETNTNSSANHEVDVNNNNSLHTGTIGFDVRPVTSVPTISIEDGKIYENLTPDANKGDYDESAGATIRVGGIDAGETATVTLTFESKTGVDFTSSDPGDGMRVEYDGKEYPVEFKDGKWTVTIEVAGSDQAVDGELIFKPGHNYNSSDITVSYDITVTDNASGQVKNWNNTTPGSDGYQDNSLGILVDAVAQQPVLGGIGVDYTASCGNSAFVRGGSVVLETTVAFQDVADGSEKHYLLVEAKANWNAPKSVVIVDVNGLSHEIPVTWVTQKYDGDMYYRLEIPNSYIDLYGVDGKITVKVWIQSPADATDTSFKIGAAAWEDVTQADLEIRSDNNAAFVIGDPVAVKFDQAGGIKLTPQGPAYENDTPNAHQDDSKQADWQPDETPAGGVIITVSYDADDTVTDFTFTNYDRGTGILYYGNDTDGYTEINPNGHVGNLTPGYNFKFVPAHNHSDADVPLNFTATVTNTNSGDSQSLSGETTVVVDAVAQLPTESKPDDPNAITVTHETKTADDPDDRNTQTAKFKVTAAFSDFDPADGSEQHFVLIEAKANMAVVDENGQAYALYYGPDGAAYYKIPVSNADIQQGSGTVIIDVTMEIISRKLGFNHTQDTLKVGALSVETTLSGGEHSYHNNVAFMKDGSITINHDWPDGHVIWVDPAYENNTPDANLDDPNKDGIQPDETPGTGGKIYFGTVGGEPVTEVTLTWDSAAGGIWVNGTLHTSGPLTVSGTDLDKIYFVPNENYSDADTTLGYTAKNASGGTASGDFPVIVDAVAQMPSDLTTDVDYGDAHTAAGVVDGHGNEGVVTVTIGGTFPDNTDGSEKHYALIEKQPGFTLETAHDEVYLDGKTYYRVEIPAGGSSVDVQIKLDGTTTEYTLKTGLMAEETNAGSRDNLEADRGNNVAWNLEGSIVIEVSPVDSTASVRINDMTEPGEGDAAMPVVVNWTAGDFDTVNYIEFTYDPSTGAIGYTGSGTPIITENPNGTVTIRLENPTDADKGNFTFRPGDYSDKDAAISWKVEAEDSRSGDVKEIGGKVTVIVDAKAQAPDVSDAGFTSPDGLEAAVSGGQALASATLTFADRDGSETHYAVLEQDGIWKCGKVEINGRTYDVKTIFGEDGTPYYAVEITNDMLDASGSVTVDFILTAPDRAADVKSDLRIGGISIEPATGAGSDKELSLGNNWDEGFANVEVKIGVVETTAVTLNAAGSVKENQGDGDTQWTKLTFDVDGNNETVTGATISDLGGGTIVDATGEKVGTYAPDGSVTLTAAQIAAGIYYRPADYNGDDVTLSFTATVTDTASGATREYTDNAAAIVDVTPVDTAPSSVAGTETSGPESGRTAHAPGDTITLTVDVAFPDHDGSEKHYLLVEVIDGLTCVGAIPDDHVTIGGKNYHKVPVPSDTANMVSQEVKLIVGEDWATDGNVAINVGGLAQESALSGPGASRVTAAPEAVTVAISAVQSVADDVTVNVPATATEDTAIPLTVDTSSLASGESITSVTFTNLNGGSIVDGTGAPVTQYSVADFLAGNYYYLPKADYSGAGPTIGYSVTVTDTASGAVKSLNGTISMPDINPVTDGALSATGAAGEAGYTANGEHQATATVTLNAAFKDNDGSESHFILVKLPAGVHADGTGWGTQLASDSPYVIAGGYQPGDAVYMVAVGSGNVSATLNVLVDAGYSGGSISYRAGSIESALTGGVVSNSVWGPGGSASINVSDIVFNTAPELTADGKSLNFQRGATQVNGTVGWSDAEGDPVTLSVQGGATGGDGKITVTGQYGTLSFDPATGAYTYTLTTNSPEAGKTDVFTILGTDNFSGGALSGSVNLVITLSDQNNAPTAETQTVTSGGVNVDELQDVTGAFAATDRDGDFVTFTGIGAANGPMVMNGTYGTLTITEDGSYTYVRTDTHSTGSDSFTLHFNDGYGGTGSGTLIVQAAAVNHAPEISATQETDFHLTATGPSGLTGTLDFSDIDGAGTAHLASVTYDGHTYEIEGNGWNTFTPEGAGFSIQVNADGDYIFTPAAGIIENVAHTLTFTVADGGGLTDSVELSFTKDGVNEMDELFGISGASFNLASGGGLLSDQGGMLLYDNLTNPDPADASDSGLRNIINASHGADILTGTEGTDTFRWTMDDMPDNGQTVTDVIRDFDHGLDFIELILDGIDADSLRAEILDGKMQIAFDVNGGTQNILLDNCSVDTQQAANQLLQQLIEHNIKTNAGG